MKYIPAKNGDGVGGYSVLHYDGTHPASSVLRVYGAGSTLGDAVLAADAAAVLAYAMTLSGGLVETARLLRDEVNRQDDAP